MNDGPTRTTVVQTITSVRYVAGTFGPERANPPSLGHLRRFVAECHGLPDDTKVTLQQGQLDEGGRYTFTFSVHIVSEGPS